MKFAISAFALCVVLGGTTTAMADHHDSGFGIGVARTAFVQGLDARLALTDEIGLEVVLGFNTIKLDVMGNTSTTTDIALAARGLYGLWDFGSRARVFGLGGFSIDKTTDIDAVIGLEGGLKIEYFPVPYASLSVDFGVAIGIGTSDGADVPSSATLIDIGGGTLMGGAGWNFWW